MKAFILPGILFIIGAGLIWLDLYTNGYNGTLTVLGGISGILMVISLPLQTLIAKWIKKWNG